MHLNDSENSGIPESILNQNPALSSLGSRYTAPDSDCELGTNCADFTVCDDDDVIGRIDPPTDVSPYHFTAEKDSVRPHTKKDDSSTSLSGAQQVTPVQLMSLDSVSWAPGIVDLKLDNPSNELTTVSILILVV